MIKIIEILTESSKILCPINICILGLKSLLRNNLMSDWVLLMNCLSRTLPIRLRIKVFADETFDMASVSWNLLFSDHVSRSTLPVYSFSTVVSENFLIFINSRDIYRTVHSSSFVLHGSNFLDFNRVDASIVKDFPLDLTCSSTESLVFRGNMTRVTRKILFVVIRWFSKCCHDGFILPLFLILFL